MATTHPSPAPTDAHPTTIRVASVPASHVYVRHLADPDRDDGVVRLRDVPPADGRLVPGGWWPPVMLDGAWIRAHAGEFDVFHVHFGFDAKTPEELEDVVAALAEIAVPLVLTVHDLRNPHHADPAVHDVQLGVLVRGAAALITLTPGAAAEIRRRWDRGALVVPHPHVVEPERATAPRPPHDDVVFGVHAKSLRANMDAVGVAAAVADALADLPGTTLRIDLHDELLDPDNYYYAPQAVEALHALGRRHAHVEVRQHAYFTDDELWDYLAGLDVSVLPYRFGTHSGWLEACRDLGTAVVAPDCGYYAEQGPCWVYGQDEEHLDVASLRAAVRGARASRTHAPDDAARAAFAAERREQRRAVAAAHRRLYAGLLR
jgi:glycosyltransferase involved in cell wall biosynthesis